MQIDKTTFSSSVLYYHVKLSLKLYFHCLMRYQSKDLASTFLDPDGFIGFKIGDAGLVLSLLLLFPNVISSKKPFASSFMVPSPSNARIF